MGQNKCYHCGKEIEKGAVYPEEWADHPFCSWDCVLALQDNISPTKNPKAGPVHKNDTGSFQELAHASDVEFGQLSLLTIAPRCTRGGHYHTHKREWFCCLHGKCYMTTTEVRTGEQTILAFQEGNKKFILINPYEAHVVSNPSDKECEMLVISSEEYDPDNTDTITYQTYHKYPEECEVHGIRNCRSCGKPPREHQGKQQ